MSPAAKQVEVALAIIFDRRAAPGIGTGTAKLLICQRKADTVLGGYWEFPGGKCNPGEAPADCAVRETREETGLEIQVLFSLSPIQHDYPHAKVHLHPFICEWRGGELALLEVAQARWIDPERIVNYQFPEANAALVKSVAKGLEFFSTAAKK